MAGERPIPIDLGDGTTMVVVAEQVGSSLVADTDVVSRLTAVTASIEKVGHEVLTAVRRAAPTSASVELGFGLAIEQGQLVALLGRGKAEATIKVTLHWQPDPAAGSPPASGGT